MVRVGGSALMRATARLPGMFGALRRLPLRRVELETIFGVAHPVLDISLVFAAAVIAYTLHFKLGVGPDTPYQRAPFFYPLFGAFELLFIASSFALRSYRSPARLGLVVRLFMAFSVVSLAMVMTITATYLLFPNQLELAKVMLALFWVTAITLVFAGRTLLARLVRILAGYGAGSERVLILGAGPEARQVIDILAKYPGPKYTVVGHLAAGDDTDSGATDAPVLGRLSILLGVIAEHEVDKVIVAIPSLDTERILEIANVCDSERVGVWLLPDHFQLMLSPVDENELSGLPLMAINDVRLKGVSRLVKRIVDIALASVLLVILSGPMLVVALAIWVFDRGGIFYVQERSGHDGRRFPLIKFRTMTDDADQQGREWTVPDDPRVTKIGGLLRRFSIDELPQLINVLLGQLALVGPRPELPVYVREFARLYPRYTQRHREKSGMTGWAQVNGLRGDVSIAERTLYDLYYVENWSLGLDFRILLRTLVEVVRGRAY